MACAWGQWEMDETRGCRPEEETDMHIDNADTGHRVPRSLSRRKRPKGQWEEQMVLS